MPANKPSDFSKRRLCSACIGEPYFSAEVNAKGKRLRCSYCDQVGKAYYLPRVADRIADVFEEHFHLTPDNPTEFESYHDQDWDREGEPVIDVIESLAKIPREAAEDLQALLRDTFDDPHSGEESDFADDSKYEELGIDDGALQYEWDRFEQSLQTQTRYFNKFATEHLQHLFGGIGHRKSSKGQPLVVAAGPGTSLTSLYRARVFQADKKLQAALTSPAQDLGSPPPDAAVAGRMNARGISVFYGATSHDTALAEVRPPVNARVAVARFDIIRPLRLLDLGALADIQVDKGSLFDPTYGERLEHTKFLRSLSERMTRPVMPDDELRDYLPTQAVADFLASMADTDLDGILYPSAQTKAAGLNAALFHKASKVESLALQPGTETEVSLWDNYEEGPERAYTILDVVRPMEPAPAPLPAWMADFELDGSRDDDERKPALRIDRGDITVHIIEEIQFKRATYKVSLHEWVQKPDPKLADVNLDDL